MKTLNIALLAASPPRLLPVSVKREFEYRGVKMFLHRNPPEIVAPFKWGVSDYITGARIASSDTQSLAIERAQAVIDAARNDGILDSSHEAMMSKVKTCFGRLANEEKKEK